MKFESLRIRNFRTLGSEQFIDLSNGLTIVGPNSSGKTNILKAIEMMFTGYDNVLGYETKRDLLLGYHLGKQALSPVLLETERQTETFLKYMMN